MNDDDLRSRVGSIDTDSVTRRRALAAVGSVAIGGTALSVAGSQPARAAVSVEQFSVADATFEAAEVTPVVDARIGYAYRADTVSTLWFGLTVGGEVVGETTLRTSSTELENTTDLSGRVLDSSAYEQADFAVDPGAETTVDVTVGVRFEVRDSSGAVLASDRGQDTSTVQVVSPKGETYATIGGEATISPADGG